MGLGLQKGANLGHKCGGYNWIFMFDRGLVEYGN